MVGPAPFPFEKNVGQTDPDIAYLLRAGDVQAAFSTGGFRLALSSHQPGLKPGTLSNGVATSPENQPAQSSDPAGNDSSAVAVELVGATTAAPVGAIPSETLVSYFKGNPDQWLVGVPAYQRVTYPNAWPGIDVQYERAPGVSGLKSAYVVARGADPSAIHEAWRGVSDPRLLEDGTLELKTPGGLLHQAAPVAWQDRGDGSRDTVSAQFAVLASNDDVVEVGLALGDYDAARPLTIDPPIVYSGYIGGSDFDQAASVAVDSTGAAYIAGVTKSSSSNGFPTSAGPNTNIGGGFDSFVAKVRPDGTGLVYAGYIGGSKDENTLGVAVDTSGRAYVAGSTESSPSDGFPVIAGPGTTYRGSGDGYVARVRVDGTGLEYSGYIGGKNTDSATGITVDTSGSAYVVGYTESSSSDSFPVTTGPSVSYGGNGDTYVAKIRADGTGFTYAGYVGGSQQEFAGQSVAVDSSGSAYIVGATSSSASQGFPVVGGPGLTFGGSSDAFVAKVRPDGTGLSYSGYIGGSDADQAIGVAIDTSGSAYVVGSTRSAPNQNFPAIGGPTLNYSSNGDGFIAKVRADGTGLVYSGYIGGAQDDSAIGVAVDAAGNANVIGTTRSSPNEGFPVTNTVPNAGNLSSNYSGNGDAFVSQVKPDGLGFVFSGYIGGSQPEQG